LKGFVFSKYNSVISSGIGVTSAMRPMDLQKWFDHSLQNLNPLKISVTDYGVVRQIDVSYEFIVPKGPFAIGAGTLENRSIYYPINSFTPPAVTITAYHDTASTMQQYVNGQNGHNTIAASVVWNATTSTDEFPIIGYDFNVSFRKFISNSDGFSLSNRHQIIPSSGSLTQNLNGIEPGFYAVAVTPVSPYDVVNGNFGDRKENLVKFTQPGPPTPPRNASISQPSIPDPTWVDGTPPQVPGPTVTITYQSPLWDGISGDIDGSTSKVSQFSNQFKIQIITNDDTHSVTYMETLELPDDQYYATISLPAIYNSSTHKYYQCKATLQTFSPTGSSEIINLVTT
jgi:hypothetical protein